MRFAPTRAASPAALLLLALAGCGASETHPETVPVKGKVSYQGKPVTQGTITFQPDQGQAAVGEIQPDGTFSLSTFAPQDGAVPGHYKVYVIANTADPNLIPGSSPGYKPPKDLVPKKYSEGETSGLEATVSKDRTAYDFDLP